MTLRPTAHILEGEGSCILKARVAFAAIVSVHFSDLAFALGRSLTVPPISQSESRMVDHTPRDPLPRSGSIPFVHPRWLCKVLFE